MGQGILDYWGESSCFKEHSLLVWVLCNEQPPQLYAVALNANMFFGKELRDLRYLIYLYWFSLRPR